MKINLFRKKRLAGKALSCRIHSPAGLTLHYCFLLLKKHNVRHPREKVPHVRLDKREGNMGQLRQDILVSYAETIGFMP